MFDPIGIEIRFRGTCNITKKTKELSSIIPLPFSMTLHASGNPTTTLIIDYDPDNPKYFIHTEPEYKGLVETIAGTIGITEYEHNPMWYGSLAHKIEEKRWLEFTEEDEADLIKKHFG